MKVRNNNVCIQFPVLSLTRLHIHSSILEVLPASLTVLETLSQACLTRAWSTVRMPSLWVDCKDCSSCFLLISNWTCKLLNIWKERKKKICMKMRMYSVPLLKPLQEFLNQSIWRNIYIYYKVLFYLLLDAGTLQFPHCGTIKTYSMLCCWI